MTPLFVVGAVSGPASAQDAACDQATAQVAKVQGKLDTWRDRLAKAKKQLHQAHAHGTAAEFQAAKDRVRRAKGKVFTLKNDLAKAVELQLAACSS